MTSSTKLLITVMGGLVGCSSPDITAPDVTHQSLAPEAAKVAHYVSHQHQALGVTQIGAETWFVAINRQSLYLAGTPFPEMRGTELGFGRVDGTGTVTLENWTVIIPDADFDVGGRNRDWSVHTTIPGHGTIDLTFRNSGVWERRQNETTELPDGTVSQLRGNVISGGFGDVDGLSGTLLGVSVNPNFSRSVLAIANSVLNTRAP